LDAITASRRKTMGQYFTARPVAAFMASLAAVRQRHVRILDPGAGSGILACAACERLAEQATPPSSIYLDAYEADAAVAEVLEGVLAQLREWLHGRNIALSYRVYPPNLLTLLG
jgi:adenine-specific DNA-methyltransferase